ncbi:glycosyltransferase family 1 protein [Lactobacillus helveticus]|uniref:beta 1-4 rhamnosyltransferase Cps2T n=1 Tax=Lactobacillus helveticus TaxID=1587 RepID=UPI001C651293|nr:glycosyltransferase family 1 protein [Lactobacillus helveticus]MBW8013726.1 glycosyltransferase family 1 protein [Lactobacillus helveticus]
MKHIFIVGSKGIPAQYGGYETFVDNLVSKQVSKDIKYHVACMTFDKNTKDYSYQGAECHQIHVPDIGGPKAILYDLKALKWALNTIKRAHLTNGIIYILACRIGPFIHSYIPEFHQYGFQVWVNPDGHEWLRAKWSKPVRKYWKISESGMVKNADLLICDSKNIEKYIHQEYDKYNPKTTFIAYGADITKSPLTYEDKKVQDWYKAKEVMPNGYYLIVGRFVPENNYETMIREFMASKTKKDLVIITNVEKNAFYNSLKEKTHFDQDKRIKFVGTVYDKDLLKFIRENAYGYLHGHSVGGTNPSLLEALGSTKLNLLYNVGFNREVGESAALYWSKTPGFLSELIEEADNLTSSQIENLGKKAKQRVIDGYSWEKIVDKYENTFLKD